MSVGLVARRAPEISMAADDDHLQIFQNYEKLKKQIKNSLKAIFFNLISSTNIF